MRRWYIRKMAAVVLGVALPAAALAQNTFSAEETTPLTVPPVTVLAPQVPAVDAPKVIEAPKPADVVKPVAPVAPIAVVPVPVAAPAPVIVVDVFRAATPYNPIRVNVPTPNPDWNRHNFVIPCDLPLNLDTFIPRYRDRWFGACGGCDQGNCGNGGCGNGGGCGKLNAGDFNIGGWFNRDRGCDSGCNSGCDKGCGSKFSFGSLFNRGGCVTGCNTGCDDGCKSKGWSFGGLFHRDGGCDTGCGKQDHCCTPVKQCGHTETIDNNPKSAVCGNFLRRAYTGPSADLGCYGCSTCRTEATFIFGSCRAFYGESPCRTGGHCGQNGCAK